MPLANAAQLLADGETIRGLLSVSVPSDDQLIDAGRLLSRYQSHAYRELRESLLDAIDNWGMSPAEVQKECRRLWANGYRPLVGLQEDVRVSVGSGADVAADE